MELVVGVVLDARWRQIDQSDDRRLVPLDDISNLDVGALSVRSTGINLRFSTFEKIIFGFAAATSPSFLSR